ncbi:oligosaccharide biosynthesis protein Alg14-like protein [Dendryphion nanum]|uniref:UDP-N-acetylglucosamine transferase subunit ALG14 n=1 Tax=Dendryphion nanum TaxID=256645 RepID=A0A9P9IN92_9PLEO|nr:oligosaccharide biosynthesis protein Alg14-like protein [Dendryphion nanum]
MAPSPAKLYTTSFILAFLITVFVASSLRLLAILPAHHFRAKSLRRKPYATRILIVLGSGGHTHEMFHLLRDLNTQKYTHRTYIVSSGDAFSAQRAAYFEAQLEENERLKCNQQSTTSTPNSQSQNGSTITISQTEEEGERLSFVGPDHYNISTIPRARKIHQPLLTTPFTSLVTLLSSIKPLLSSPSLLPNQPPQNPYEAVAQDVPDLIMTNGPATGVIIVLASLLLRFFNIRGANSRGKCRTIYVESFARVKTLSLSGKLLIRVVDRFLVQWEELEGRGGGRAEFWGVLV